MCLLSSVFCLRPALAHQELALDRQSHFPTLRTWPALERRTGRDVRRKTRPALRRGRAVGLRPRCVAILFHRTGRRAGVVDDRPSAAIGAREGEELAPRLVAVLW